MCICVNCKHVNNCVTYQLIRKQHNDRYNSHLYKNSFVPNKTLININIIYINQSIYYDWDLIECLSFIETPGQWILHQ
uniref:Ycf34 n=1 Tax=Gracilaria firma TaxID=2510791 RepID=A0A2Z2JIG8_9FLOR|nr:Ycf34 [Gracilaria changii]ART65197.1 Ycf34 [Gracilaria changii]